MPPNSTARVAPFRSISLHVAPFPFNSWKLDILGETGSLLGSRMITIEADLLAADAVSGGALLFGSRPPAF